MEGRIRNRAGRSNHIAKIAGSPGLKARWLDYKEVPWRQRHVGRPPFEDLFNAAIHQAHVRHGYAMEEIADHLGIHYSTVSRAIRRAEM